MSTKVPIEMRPDYNKVKEEYNRLKAEGVLDKMKNDVYEMSIFKTLPPQCTKCGETKMLTLDHIVPQSLLQDLGVFDIIEDNYQILCRYCNHKKSNRLDMLNPKTKEILRKIIN
jgi:5-methylcytosine-specific restriction endonuclease McrA